MVLDFIHITLVFGIIGNVDIILSVENLILQNKTTQTNIKIPL